jgi:6-phosphofructokinase 1
MIKKIGVFTSGGDAPGMNACIRAVVRTAIYNGLEVCGIKRGYNGMIKGDILPMNTLSVSNILQRGGTILKSARSTEFMTPEGRKKAYDNLVAHGIDALVAIGGNGTFTGAKIFFEEFGIPTIGAPGTIDNDLYGTDYTIGFDTAVNTALESIDKIRDTADAHDRIFFIEVMGRDSGFIAFQSGIGGGAELIMVPETTTTINEVIEVLTKNWESSKTSCVVIVAEGDEEGNADEIAAKVKGKIPYNDIKVTRLGHVQRGGTPTAFDRILSSRMGMCAVEALLAGRKCEMVGIVNNEVVYTPFGDAINLPKPIHPDMIRMARIL